MLSRFRSHIKFQDCRSDWEGKSWVNQKSHSSKLIFLESVLIHMFFHSAMIFQGHSYNTAITDYEINER